MNCMRVKFHYCPYNSPKLVHVRSQIHSVYTLPCYFSNIHPKITYHLRIYFSSSLFPLHFHIKTLVCTSLLSTRAICPAHPTLLDLLTLTIFVFERKRSLSRPLLPLRSLRLKYLSPTFTNALSRWSSLNVEDRVSYPCKTSTLIFIKFRVRMLEVTGY